MKLHTTKIKLSPEQMQDDIKNRNHYIGGSDVGTIMGCNPWKSPYTLWAEKVGLIEPKDLSDVEAVWWGVHLEDLIAERFTMKTGIKTRRSNFAYGVIEYPFLRGHVDRVSTKGKIGIECKSTGIWNKVRYDLGEVPDQHWWQCMFYMAITGYNEWYLATKRDNQFYVTKVNRDEEAIERMLDACQDFWNHVVNAEPVEIDGSESTEKTIGKLYPDSAPATVDLRQFEDTLMAKKALNEQNKSIDELKTKYCNEIKAFMGEADRGSTEHFTVTWKTNSKGIRAFKITDTL